MCVSLFSKLNLSWLLLLLLLLLILLLLLLLLGWFFRLSCTAAKKWHNTTTRSRWLRCSLLLSELFTCVYFSSISSSIYVSGICHIIRIQNMFTFLYWRTSLIYILSTPHRYWTSSINIYLLISNLLVIPALLSNHSYPFFFSSSHFFLLQF